MSNEMEGLFPDKGSNFTFVATAQDIQKWLNNLGDPWDFIYRVDVDESNLAFRRVMGLEIGNFISATKEKRVLYFWISSKIFEKELGVPSYYHVNDLNFDRLMSYNGFIRLCFDYHKGFNRISSLSAVYSVFGYDGRVFKSTFSRKAFERLRRIARKDLIYHTFYTPSIDPIPKEYIEKPVINELINATEAAIEAYQNGCNWLPGPKKEVKPRARKKKT